MTQLKGQFDEITSGISNLHATMSECAGRWEEEIRALKQLVVRVSIFCVKILHTYVVYTYVFRQLTKPKLSNWVTMTRMTKNPMTNLKRVMNQPDPFPVQGDPKWLWCIPLMPPSHTWNQLFRRYDNIHTRKFQNLCFVFIQGERLPLVNRPPPESILDLKPGDKCFASETNRSWNEAVIIAAAVDTFTLKYI